MTQSDANSNATASSTTTGGSNASSESFDLERDIPTSEEDLRALKDLYRQPGENLLPRVDELPSADAFENIAPRRTTSEGWEPFEL